MNLIHEYFKLKHDWYNAPRIAELVEQIKNLSEEDQVIFKLLGGNL